ncbi:MAG TPA: hypothetical protein VFB49_08400 [Patescibacteria group bacterium]|nr:hypothetical protein [Patescibacteria group bacterium]
MTGQPQPPPRIDVTVESRRGLLSLFGLIEILVGAACFGLLCVMSVIWLFAGRLPPEQRPILETSNLVLSVLLYAGAAGFFVVMGLGTIYARRWARAIMLIVSWPWLLNMVALLIFLAVILRPMLARLEGSPDTPFPTGAGITPAMMVAIPFGLCVLLALLPLSFIIFYTRPGVRRTFDTADRRPCWTDGRPLSVLALALVTWAGAAACLAGTFYGAFALFGWMLTGAPAVAASLVAAGLCVWLGLGLYRMTPAGWWANLGFALLLHLSWWMSLSRLGVEGILGSAQIDSERTQALRQAGLLALFGSSWLVLLSAVIWIAVLVGLKRHFRTGCPPSRREDQPSPIHRFPAA